MTDGNARDLITLRDYMESRLMAIKATMDASDQHMRTRLEQMNELREQITKERTSYISRDEHGAVHKALESDIRVLRESRAELAGKASVTAVFFSSAVSILAIVVALASLVYSIAK